MKKKFCSQEKEVLAELKEGFLGSKIKDHLKECEICRQTLMVSKMMRRLQEDTEERLSEFLNRSR